MGEVRIGQEKGVCKGGWVGGRVGQWVGRWGVGRRVGDQQTSVKNLLRFKHLIG